MKNVELYRYRDIEYVLVKSRRRTCSVHILRDGRVELRVPLVFAEAKAKKIIESKYGWIVNTLEKVRKTGSDAALSGAFTSADIKQLRKCAAALIPERVRYYAGIAGITYGKITIRSQTTRWGSCSAAGNLSFNCLLAAAPPEVIDSVVVHELCHRKEMNHSSAFYSEVKRIFPEYDRWHGWLKINGPVLIERMIAGRSLQTDRSDRQPAGSLQ